MNPFRSRKKSFAEGEGGKTRPSLDNAPAMPSFTSGRGMTFRKKKQAPEPKPELNLEDALPSNDNFRTSLLMPNLSARFSMLREQDDPYSKLGKANDDSVLFPRRQSKLGLFASEDNQDGYGTDDGGSVHGSIMSRAKPGQGNKFFGGRQVVYKVPVEGKRQLNDDDDEATQRPMGKAMYNDDISMSTFQKLRQERKQEERESLDRGERSSNENYRCGSPPLSGYNRKRETSSSTNSGPPEGRTSTAATSIASQPGVSWYASGNSSFGTKPSPVTTPGTERPPKGKRLYGQGLDQQMLEQQSSTVNRLNSAQRNGRNAPGAMGLSRSTSNLNERFQKSSIFHPVTGPRSNSPSPAVQSAGLGGFDFSSSGAQQSRSASKDREGVARETPPMSPDPTLAAALNANDLGKATASGAFNKPKTQYNEQQYTQRQFQLQEGRDTPPLRSMSRQDQQFEYTGRMRNGSMASVQSGHSSKHQYRTNQSSRAPSSASNYKARASPVDSNQAANGTYFADSGSEYGSHPNSPEPELPTLKPATYKKTSTENLTRSTIYEHDDQHPAFRNQPDRLYIEPSDSEEDKSSPHRVNQGTSNIAVDEERKMSMDSPTLGGIDANDGLGSGLSDLVKGHLRNHSNASSVYPSSPGMDQENGDDWNKAQNNYLLNRPSFDKTAMPPPLTGDRARQVLQQANQLANANAKAHDVLGGVGSDKISQILGPEVPRRSHESARPWQDQMKGHSRGPSTETQKEREDFASELADRRKQVQEKLKNFAEDSSKPSSSSSESSAKPGTFGGLLKKSSRGSLVRGNDDSNKAAKMLGIGNTHPSSSTDAHASKSDATGKAGTVDGQAHRERGVGTERREKFFRKGSNPHEHIQRFNAPDAAPPPPPAPFGFQRSRTDPANQPMSFHPAGRARKYSPPRPTTVAPGSDIAASEPISRANSANGHRAGPAKSPGGSYFPPQLSATGSSNLPTQSIGFPSVGPPPRLPQGFSHSTPPMEHPPGPTMISPSSQSRADKYSSSRKRSVSKHEISEPMFLSGTSSVTTVDLPPGASLNNGMEMPPTSPPKHAPPVPPFNPRRKYQQGQSGVQMTQNLFTAFGGRSPNMPPGMSPNGTHSQPGSAHPDNAGAGMGMGSESFDRERERSSGDRPRARLRKTSSEGGSMNARARHQALMRDAEAIGMVR